MENEIKLDTQTLELIKSLSDQYNEITFQLGQIKIEKIRLEDFENTVIKQLQSLQELEKSTSEQIQKNYGEGVLNLETGIFTPSQTTV
jgi:hypothetical protein